MWEGKMDRLEGRISRVGRSVEEREEGVKGRMENVGFTIVEVVKVAVVVVVMW